MSLTDSTMKKDADQLGAGGGVSSQSLPPHSFSHTETNCQTQQQEQGSSGAVSNPTACAAISTPLGVLESITTFDDILKVPVVHQDSFYHGGGPASWAGSGGNQGSVVYKVKLLQFTSTSATVDTASRSRQEQLESTESIGVFQYRPTAAAAAAAMSVTMPPPSPTMLPPSVTASHHHQPLPPATCLTPLPEPDGSKGKDQQERHNHSGVIQGKREPSSSHTQAFLRRKSSGEIDVRIGSSPAPPTPLVGYACLRDDVGSRGGLANAGPSTPNEENTHRRRLSVELNHAEGRRPSSSGKVGTGGNNGAADPRDGSFDEEVTGTAVKDEAVTMERQKKVDNSKQEKSSKPGMKKSGSFLVLSSPVTFGAPPFTTVGASSVGSTTSGGPRQPQKFSTTSKPVLTSGMMSEEGEEEEGSTQSVGVEKEALHERRSTEIFQEEGEEQRGNDEQSDREAFCAKGDVEQDVKKGSQVKQPPCRTSATHIDPLSLGCDAPATGDTSVDKGKVHARRSSDTPSTVRGSTETPQGVSTPTTSSALNPIRRAFKKSKLCAHELAFIQSSIRRRQDLRDQLTAAESGDGTMNPDVSDGDGAREVDGSRRREGRRNDGLLLRWNKDSLAMLVIPDAVVLPSHQQQQQQQARLSGTSTPTLASPFTPHPSPPLAPTNRSGGGIVGENATSGNCTPKFGGGSFESISTPPMKPVVEGRVPATIMYPSSSAPQQPNGLTCSGGGSTMSQKQKKFIRRSPSVSSISSLTHNEGAVVVPQGILMPLYHCNLQELLRRVCGDAPVAKTTTMKKDNGVATANDMSGAATGGGFGGAEPKSFYRTTQTFRPLWNLDVVSAIMWQIARGLSALSTQLHHEFEGKFFTGFTHNDLRLENVLVEVTTGRVAICDFELVGHICNRGEKDADSKSSALCGETSRLPPMAYWPPEALWKEKSDVWCFGLLVMEVLTGIRPLLDEQVIQDDFGDGPIRSLRNPGDDDDAEWALPVLDWEDNIEQAVLSILDIQAIDNDDENNCKDTAKEEDEDDERIGVESATTTQQLDGLADANVLRGDKDLQDLLCKCLTNDPNDGARMRIQDVCFHPFFAKRLRFRVGDADDGDSCLGNKKVHGASDERHDEIELDCGRKTLERAKELIREWSLAEGKKSMMSMDQEGRKE